MIQIDGLTLTHRKDCRVMLKDFNLVLNDGDKAVIIGEEGNGKSTLMRWLYDPLSVDGYMEANGRRILGEERLGYLSQELSNEDRQKTVYEYFAENDFFWEQSQKDLAGLTNRFRVEIDFFYRDQTMASLSGGEKIKAQLMKLFMHGPTVLLMDEPSNDIDIATLELLEGIINEWKQTVLFISHDELLIERTANMVIHIEQIQRKTKARHTVSKMPYREYIEERLHLYERKKQQVAGERREKKMRDEKYRKIFQSVERSLKNCPWQSKDKMHTVKAMGRRFAKEDENMTEMPEEENAIFFRLGDRAAGIPAGKTVIEYALPKLSIFNEKGCDEEKILSENIFLRVRGAEKICIVGENGVGKTTLIRKIAEELLKREDICAEYMPQNYEELLDLDMTPVDYLDRSGDKAERTRIRTYLGSLKYTADEMGHSVKELSGGQKAKIFLLKMSLSGANVLILDEPTRNFSPLSGPVIRKMLRDFPGAVISISHDRKYIGEVCDKVYELSKSGLHFIEYGDND